MTDETERRLAEALEIHRIEDAWGGYWQTGTTHGPYNSRILAGIILEKCKDLMNNQQRGRL